MAKKEYAEKWKDPRWQKKRLEILERDEWMCRTCFDSESTLAVHHLVYFHDKEPWEYEDRHLITLCQMCHESEHNARKLCEAKLANALKEKCFMGYDVEAIAIGFEKLEMPHLPDVTSSAIEWALKTPGIMSQIVDMYFDFLSKTKGEDDG